MSAYAFALSRNLGVAFSAGETLPPIGFLLGGSAAVVLGFGSFRGFGTLPTSSLGLTGGFGFVVGF